MLWFPECGLVVPTCLQTFDLHALAQFSPKDLGVRHGLVSPEIAMNLEDAGLQARGRTQPVASLTLTVKIDCNDLESIGKVKVQLCVYARCNNQYTNDCLGSDITEQEANKHSTCVLTAKEMQVTQQEGIDIMCLLGNPSDCELPHTFLLVGRVLPSLKPGERLSLITRLCSMSLRQGYQEMFR